jgi:hypothetical protein
MGTFCTVNDAVLIRLIQKAVRRIVFIAPGVHEEIANALGQRFSEVGGIEITIIIDPDEDVCRIGYGDLKGLQRLQELAKHNGFWVKSQPGLRVGVVLADDQMLVWSPTPRSVEAPPSERLQDSNSLFEPAGPAAPNGLVLGQNPGEQVAMAIAAEGKDSNLYNSEIGKTVLSPEQVKEAETSLTKNPPIPVDLARVTRVFSTKLQFVEFTIKRAKLSRMQLKVPSNLLNADVKGELQGLIESKLHAFADLRETEIKVPAFVKGEKAYDFQNKQIFESVSESSLERFRHDIEKRFMYNIPGYGRLIEKDSKAEFDKQVDAYTVQITAHSEGLRKLLDEKASEILDEAVDLILTRKSRSYNATPEQTIDRNKLRTELQKGLNRAKAEYPVVKKIFKDVTYEQTQSQEFRERVRKVLPAPVRKRLGNWDEHFQAAKALTS